MKKEKSFGAYLRRTFLAGLLIMIPLFVTYVLVAFLFNLFSGAGTPIVKGAVQLLGLGWLEGEAWFAFAIPAANLLLTFFVIFLLGLVGTNVLGRRALGAFDALLFRLPIVKSVYGATKQLVDTFRDSSRGSFQKVVLVEYPRPGVWTMGLVAAERPDSAGLSQSKRMLSVFIPTTPNPTSGMLVLVPKESAVEIDYAVEDAFKFVISAGIVGDELRRKAEAPRSS